MIMVHGLIQNQRREQHGIDERLGMGKCLVLANASDGKRLELGDLWEWVRVLEMEQHLWLHYFVNRYSAQLIHFFAKKFIMFP